MEKMPVFVKIEEYQDVLEILSQVKEKLFEAKTTLHKIIELKETEDAEIDAWKAGIEDVEKKMEYVHQSLTRPETE
jgi:predicted nuclease with TOPRIM domain